MAWAVEAPSLLAAFHGPSSCDINLNPIYATYCVIVGSPARGADDQRACVDGVASNVAVGPRLGREEEWVAVQSLPARLVHLNLPRRAPQNASGKRAECLATLGC
jgi:hypothetical protein